MKCFHAALVFLATGCATTGAVRTSAPDAPDPAESAWTALEQFDPASALPSFDAALAVEDDARLHAGRARALYRLGRMAEAEAGWLAALSRRSEAAWHVGLAAVRLARADAVGAVTACDAALEDDPESADAFYNRGLAHAVAGDEERALADLAEALRLDPQRAPAYNNRGVLLARNGRSAEALSDFRTAIALDPALLDAHVNAAAAHYALGDVAQALVELNAAAKLDRRDPRPLLQRGRIYLDLGEPEAAIADFEGAARLVPDHPHPRALLAEARAELAEVSE